MKAGDIVFVRGKSLLSKIIRFFDKGEFSHVVIAISETEVLEAQYFTRSRITPFYFEDYEILDLGLSEEERQQVAELGPVLEGRLYDYILIISYLFKHPLNNPNQLICSELVAKILSEIGYADYQKIKDLKPNELYRYLQEEK